MYISGQINIPVVIRTVTVSWSYSTCVMTSSEMEHPQSKKLKLFFSLGPVVQSVVSLTISLRVILLTVLADSIYNILIFFAEKM